MAAVRLELEDFVEEVFTSLPRKDQRAKGGLYLRGLMLDGKRKSIQPMSERLGIDHQQLQQFTAASTWAVEPVRRRLARLATETIDPRAWVIDDTGFKKDGPSSPGVARQYSGTLGKIGNCQIGVSLHAATDAASCPLDWRLFIPESWDDTRAATNEEAEEVAERRARAGIPDTVRHRTKWAQALEMIDEATTWGLVPPVVVADAGYGEITAFRHGLADRDIRYVLVVKSTTTAHLDTDTPERLEQTPGKGRPSVRRYRGKPLGLQGLARSAGRKALHQVTWRHGTKTKPDNRGAAMKSRFMALRIRPANRDIPRAGDGSLPEAWMLAE